ncbi:hypothetical protein DQ04_00661070 [Trypanosoma grayi]|uniref:hypothetical protein n=1 Tax=Trypanosoma grayi TaxID=71804 RepID=UPI0004F420C4|nr:hypothetical protein DQ04_00661070 [Trypanosoma grayi]KEG14029.1 hypothetical protein DQ04_00661070 [Trypanosoma grayi]
MDADPNETTVAVLDTTEANSVENRIARRRSTLPSMELPDGSGGIPVSKNCSFVEANLVSDPQVWNHRFNGAFITPSRMGPSNEESSALSDPNADRPRTPEVTCCSLFFS